MSRVPGLKYFPAENQNKFLALIIFGLVVFSIGFLQTPNYPKPLQASQEQVTAEPSRISIPKIGVNADIVRGGITGGEWILSETQVLYLPTTGKLGEGFNTVLYGHKKPGLFVDLKKLNKGDEVIVSDNQGKKFTYEVYQMEYIEPKQTEKLISTRKDDLTMFTCDGPFDETRLLIRAKFV